MAKVELGKQLRAAIDGGPEALPSAEEVIALLKRCHTFTTRLAKENSDLNKERDQFAEWYNAYRKSTLA